MKWKLPNTTLILEFLLDLVRKVASIIKVLQLLFEEYFCYLILIRKSFVQYVYLQIAYLIQDKHLILEQFVLYFLLQKDGTFM